MQKVVMIHSSMLLQGDFDNWDFRYPDELYGVKEEAIEKLKEYQNQNRDIILSKKASRALQHLYDNLSLYVIVNSPYISYDKIYVATIADFLLLNDITKRENKEVILYTPKLKENIPTFSKYYLPYIYDNSQTCAELDALKINQYFITETEDEPMLFKVGESRDFKEIKYQYFDNDFMGQVKPKDLRQLAAIDSLNHNQLTMLTGRAGSGKSHLAISALFQKLQKNQIDAIYMFCNPVATRDSAKIGLYPGTKDEKLLDSQIGNFLDGKIGDRTGVESLIRENKLKLLPMSDIRGFDTNGKRAGIYITEAQNSTIDLMQLALERVGEDCICIIDGDYQKQVDLDIYSDINNGMKKVNQVYFGQPFYGEVYLTGVYRSKIAKLAAQMKD